MRRCLRSRQCTPRCGWAQKTWQISLARFDVTLGLDALIPLRPEWVVIYVVTFLFWMMGLLFAARQDEELCFRFASGVIIAEIICCVIFIAFPSCITRPELAVSDFFTGVLSLVYFFDTPTNCFPSMHCLFAYLVFRQSLSSPAQSCGTGCSAPCLRCSCACQRCLLSSTSSPTLSAAYSSASWHSFWDKNCPFGKYLLKSIKNSCNPLHDMV